MKKIVFDTGPLITLTLNNILWILESLHERSDVEFYITPEVYKELIERPLATKKYKFEALQILPLVTRGILKLEKSPEIEGKAMELLGIANSMYRARGNDLKIVHKGEMEVLACALLIGSGTVAIDERTTRVLVESPDLLEKHLEKKLHTNVEVNHERKAALVSQLSGLKVIRSFEVAAIAYELGLLNMFMQKDEEKAVPDLRRAVLEGVLWGVKLNGCSVKREDIDRLVQELA